MRLDALRVMDTRNIKALSLIPDPALTVIAGPNGQGKTNLLECIWLLTGSKSFRGAKDIELVREDAAFGRVEGDTAGGGRENHIAVAIAGPNSGKRGRSAKVNGVDYGRATAIAGVFTAVVFQPEHLGLIKGGPEGRRRFLDAALCQLYPSYIGTLRRFNRALSQKNALLKKYHVTPDASALLDAFDEEIATAGAEITRRRAEYLAGAGPEAERFYAEIAGGAERMAISFIPCCAPEELAEGLRKARSEDIRAGFGLFGPHREDFETTIHGRSARSFGSQGQQRSAVLALKLAEAGAAHAVTGEHPVLLLDDVLSELDATRQEYLLSRMAGKQSFVSTCEPGVFHRAGGLVLKMQSGRLEEA